MDSLALFAACVYAPTDIVEVRYLPSRMSAWCEASELAAQSATLAEQNRRRENVYAGLNPRKAIGGRDAESVALARCLAIDLDDADHGLFIERHSLSKVPDPTLLVFTGGGVQAYWRLSEPLTDLAEWTARQRAMIAAYGSDPKIHDPPRVLRLPGFTNWKPERNGAVAAVIDGNPNRAYDLCEFPAGVRVEVGGGAPLADGREHPENLGWKTRRFVEQGAPEGERNQMAFMAACELFANGFVRARVEVLILAGASRCGLDEREALAVVESASKKPRSPSRPTITDEQMAAAGWGGGGYSSPSAAAAAAAGSGGSVQGPITASVPTSSPAAKPTGSVLLGGRQVIANVETKWTRGEDGKDKATLWYRQIGEIADQLLAKCDNWPKSCCGLLFVQDDRGGVRYLNRADDLFAWMAKACDVFWHSKGPVKSGVASEGGMGTAATKGEFHAHLRACVPDRFSAVAELPHEPPIPNVFYLPYKLPDPTGKAIDRFLDLLNPETDADAQLMLGLAMTLAWGGPCGARPAFVLASAHGRGVGKSRTAMWIGELFGGYFGVPKGETWEQTGKRLMGDRAMSLRMILKDNVKGVVSAEELEAFITESTISGWRPFHGDFSRPNYMTVVMTANAPRLGADMADRAVEIRIGDRRRGKDWEKASADFIANHRAAFISDVLARLQEAPRGEIRPENRDRWGAWQNAVLRRLDDPDGLAATIAERRAMADSDTSEADDVARAIREWCHGKTTDHEGYHRISRTEMRDILVKAGTIDPGTSKKAAHSIVCNMLGSHGPLAGLTDTNARTRGDGGAERHWRWTQADNLPPV